jgi:AraC-like DNA-binding protein
MSIGMDDMDSNDEIKLIESELESVRRQLQAATGSWPEDVFRLVSSMHERCFEQGFSIQAAFHACGLTNARTYGRFAKATGQTPGKYLRTCRIIGARRLLQHGVLPIGLVAIHVGYADGSTFSRRFREMVGVLPSDYTAETTGKPLRGPVRPGSSKPHLSAVGLWEE